MKTLYNAKNHLITLVAVFFAMNTYSLHAQVSPYSISPDWAFGDGGRAVFPSGSFPTSAAPAYGARATNTVPSPEASTSVCFNDGSVAVYTNTSFAYNGASTGTWTNFIRNFNNSGDNTCAASSTGGAIAFPDPASPANAFYMVLSNDQTGGNCQFAGVNVYRFTGTGTTVAYNAGPNQICNNSFPGEAITGATDGTGGYWVIVHDRTASNIFRVWHFTSTGMTGPVDYTVGANVTSTVNTQSYLKVSPCQDKIAYHSGGTVVVHNFNRTTGVVGAELRRFATADGGVGLEFSPDGNRIFYNGPGGTFTGGTVQYVVIGSGATGTVTSSASWSLQLGPDGKIYTSPTGSNIGIISNPNGAATYATAALPAGASIFRGLSNMVWLTPGTPTINRTISSCTVDFTHLFQNYFLSNVAVNAASFQWDFGDGQTATGTTTPSHAYAASGTYTVTLSFTDATCTHTWNASTSVTVSCAAPVEWLGIHALYNKGKVDVSWSTAMELNNDYFEVQRSIDGVHFITIGQVDSRGNSNRVQDYLFEDLFPVSGGSYYRVVQHDLDGTSTASKKVYVSITSAEIHVYPNPSASNFDLHIVGSESANVVLTDVLGRTIYETNLSGAAMHLSFGEQLSSGTYILQVLTESGFYTEKLIKK